MGLFSKRKSKKQIKREKIDNAFNRVYNQIDAMDSWDDPKKLEHYILDSCEQIIASTKEMERQKTEYRVVTAYLNDVKIIEDLEKSDASELCGLATRIHDLEASISTTKSIHRNITEEQYETILQEEDSIPEIINRYTEDEIFQDKLKKNIQYLEGEKTRYEIERENIAEERKLLRSIVTVSLTSFLALLLLLFVISSSTGYDTTIMMLVIFAICSFVGFGVFLRQGTLTKNNRTALVRLNQSIKMLNVEKIKYVNITNSIEFTKDKYDVESASELQYVWQQYIDKVKDQQRMIKNNEDLELYLSRLTRFLSSLKLHDPQIWENQISALIKKEDMIEVRHRLVLRRQKIRARIEDNQQMIQNERDEIDRLMSEHQHYLPEIQEIIKSVDKLCGTSASKTILKDGIMAG